MGIVGLSRFTLRKVEIWLISPPMKLYVYEAENRLLLSSTFFEWKHLALCVTSQTELLGEGRRRRQLRFIIARAECGRGLTRAEGEGGTKKAKKIERNVLAWRVLSGFEWGLLFAPAQFGQRVY